MDAGTARLWGDHACPGCQQGKALLVPRHSPGAASSWPGPLGSARRPRLKPVFWSELLRGGYLENSSAPRPEGPPLLPTTDGLALSLDACAMPLASKEPMGVHILLVGLQALSAPHSLQGAGRTVASLPSS